MKKALIPVRKTFIGCHKFFKHKSEAIKKLMAGSRVKQ